MTKAKTIQVDNYGDMLAQINNMKLLGFYERGSYSGEYLAIMSDGERVFFYQDSYGSCSGCDWLEDENLGSASEKYNVSLKSALNYCGDSKPKYIIPSNDIDLLKSVLRTVKRFTENDDA